MKTISKISCALLGAMLLSSIFSGLVVGITEAVKLSLSTQSIQMIGGCMSSVWYVYFFQLFTKSMKKRTESGFIPSLYSGRVKRGFIP